MNIKDVIFFLATRLVCNIVIYLTAQKRLLEFKGYQPKAFPLQPPPRQIIPTPRRVSLPQDFSSGWKKIGSKKRKFGKENIYNDCITDSKLSLQPSSLPKIDNWLTHYILHFKWHQWAWHWWTQNMLLSFYKFCTCLDNFW